MSGINIEMEFTIPNIQLVGKYCVLIPKASAEEYCPKSTLIQVRATDSRIGHITNGILEIKITDKIG